MIGCIKILLWSKDFDMKPQECITNFWRNWNIVETSQGSLETIFLKYFFKVGYYVNQDSKPRKCKTTL